MVGQVLGHYAILRKIGEGGMGVVYLAEDRRLGRQVALKLLPDEFAGQRDRLQRFLSEARLASSINHPNIVSIYELGETDGRHYIAMEFVSGVSLRQLLRARALGVRKLLEIGLPAAEGLARAHRAGVIHRDIKPENLLVSDDGYVKLVDFGLAKLKPLHCGESTLSQAVSTGAGKVVGTVAYMSPEQLEGREIDARSDVFSFGVVLYEMATGHSPFLRSSAANTAAAILRDDPQPVCLLASDTPALLGHVIEKALEKDAAFRTQSIDDLAADLRRLRRDLDSGHATTAAEAPTAGRARNWRKYVVAATIAIAIGAGTAWLALMRWKQPLLPSTTRVTQLTSLAGVEDSPTWSPDGRSIAYVSDAEGNLDIYVQQIGGARALKLSDSDADDAQPAWSPDGTRIAFVSARAHPAKRLSALLNFGDFTAFFPGSHGDVWTMSALGGEARRIAQDAYAPAWSQDGRKLVYQALREGRWDLWIQQLDSPAEPRRLGLDRWIQGVLTQPAWSPDGDWIAFTGGVAGNTRIYAVPSDGGQPLSLSEPDEISLTPAWSADGRSLFFSSSRGGQQNLWEARFNSGRLGKVRQVTAGSGGDLWPRPDPSGKRLAYTSVRRSLGLWAFDFASGGAKRLTVESAMASAVPSPDGGWLAFSSDLTGEQQVWLLNRRSGSRQQVTTGLGQSSSIYTQWASDGKSLYYASRNPETGGSTIWRHSIELGASEKVYDAPSLAAAGVFCITPDQKHLVLSPSQPPGGIVRVGLVPMDNQVLFQPDEGLALEPACSPDGAWVAFHVQEGNTRKVWVVPLDGGPARQLTFGPSEDSHPTWSSDSRLIYFVRDHQDIYALPRSGGDPRAVTRYRSFSATLDYPVVTPDGKQLLFTRVDKAGDIFILENPNE